MAQPIQPIHCCPDPIVPPAPLVPETIAIPNCDGTSTPKVFPSILQRTVLVQEKPIVVCVANSKGFESLDLTRFCDVNGNLVGFGAIIKDEDAIGGIRKLFYDLTFAEVVALPIGSSVCNQKDIETITTCFRLKTNYATRYNRIDFWDTSVSPKIITDTVWQNAITGALIPIPLSTLIEPCSNESLPSPAIGFAYGNNLSGLIAAHTFNIIKDSCCEVLVTTSIGTFLVPKGVSSWNTSDFDVPFTIDSVVVNAGLCTASEILITANKLR